MKKTYLILAALLAFAMLAACGDKQQSDAETPQEQAAEESAESAAVEAKEAAVGKTVQGIQLTEYTDPEFGYSMLCPANDFEGYRLSPAKTCGCSVWGFNDKEGASAMIIGFSEYDAESSYFETPAESITAADQILDAFSAHIDCVLQDVEALRVSSIGSGDVQFSETKVNGLPAAAFQGSLSTDEREYGFCGICVLGERRPYVFWSLDESLDGSYASISQDILNACAADFQEGN